jgi:hypothetical protein
MQKLRRGFTFPDGIYINTPKNSNFGSIPASTFRNVPCIGFAVFEARAFKTPGK